MRDVEVRQEVSALDQRLEALERLEEGDGRDAGLAAVESLLRVYGEALRRTVAAIGPDGVGALQEDELISHLLLLHGLQPTTVSERVAAALEKLAPYIGSHGGGIELVGIDGDVAIVRLEGACVGCSASTATLKLAVEEAVLEAAPELRAVQAVEEHPVTHDPPGALLPMHDAGAARPMPEPGAGLPMYGAGAA